MKGKCAKQEVIAIIENNGEYVIGSNWCGSAQKICPRNDMPSGEGYHLCRDVCYQFGHAEVDAIENAKIVGVDIRGGTLYLIGHTYCCESCQCAIDRAEISKVVIGELPERFKIGLNKKIYK